MPTLIREAGFEVESGTLDHPPPHVHVARLVPREDRFTHHAREIVGAIADRTSARRTTCARHTDFLRLEWRNPCPPQIDYEDRERLLGARAR